MAVKKSKKIDNLAKAKAIVKKINTDLIDASFQVIEDTVKTGEKWQKLTAKLMKKAEPLSKKQMHMFVETADTIKGQLKDGTERLKNLVGYDPKMMEQAKKMIAGNPIVKKAEETKDQIEKDVTNSKLVKKAEKMSAKLKKEIKDTIKDIKEQIEDYTEDVVRDKNKKTKKIASPKKAIAKKTPAKKVAAKKTVAKKEKASKATPKDDLKKIKGIGPKSAETLNNAGITSFKLLAKMTVEEITKVLTDAGVRTKLFDIAAWKTQAELAVKDGIGALTKKK